MPVSDGFGTWSIALQGLEMKVDYRKGSEHIVPDALSRMYEDLNVLSLELEYTEDLWYMERKRNVSENPDKYPEWHVEKGRLYHHRPNLYLEPFLPELNKWKLVVPPDLRFKVLEDAHCPPEAGHLGREKTYHRVNLNFYWPGMYSDTERFVQGCPKCRQFKTSQQPPLGLMQERSIEYPWKVVAIDITGPFPSSKKRNAYLLVMQDVFTKYVELTVLKTATAANMFEAFRLQVICRWGCPTYLLSDNATAFAGRVFCQRLREHKITHVFTPPYHPQANPVERVNRTIKPLISIYCEQNHRDWDLYIPELAFALNTAVQSTTGFSPAFLNMARNPKMVNDIMREYDQDVKVNSGDSSVWAERMKKLEYLHDFVFKKLGHAQLKQAAHYNVGRKDTVFKEGDLVMKRYYKLSNAADYYSAKLGPKYIGPLKVKRVHSVVCYDLLDENGKTYTRIHIKDLLPYHITNECPKSKQVVREDGESPTSDCNPDEATEDGTPPTTGRTFPPNLTGRIPGGTPDSVEQPNDVTDGGSGSDGGTTRTTEDGSPGKPLSSSPQMPRRRGRPRKAPVEPTCPSPRRLRRRPDTQSLEYFYPQEDEETPESLDWLGLFDDPLCIDCKDCGGCSSDDSAEDEESSFFGTREEPRSEQNDINWSHSENSETIGEVSINVDSSLWTADTPFNQLIQSCYAGSDVGHFPHQFEEYLSRLGRVERESCGLESTIDSLDTERMCPCCVSLGAE